MFSLRVGWLMQISRWPIVPADTPSNRLLCVHNVSRAIQPSATIMRKAMRRLTAKRPGVRAIKRCLPPLPVRYRPGSTLIRLRQP